LGEMTDVAGVQDELGSNRQGINFIDGSFKGTDHVSVSGLVESHWAVLDLHEAQFAFVYLAHFTAVAKSVALQHSAFEDTESAGARPGHAAQKSATVDSVVMVVVEN